ncbi:MAG: two component, sigma54 specific, transcriptional regulator, Fis family [Labilithrix sp.]|nr:two component, sigma54 specific, transcriptional regulator, Fis family [Labilithrix sp.]
MNQEPRAPLDLEPARPRIAWRRALVLVLPVLYVAGAAFTKDETSSRAWLAILVAVIIGIAGSFVRAGDNPRLVRGRLWTSSALSLAVASAPLTERWAWVAFVRELVLIGAGLTAARALVTIDGDPGLAPRATAAETARGVTVPLLGRITAGFVVAGWGLAAFFDALVWSGLAPSVKDDSPVLAAGGGAFALFTLGAAALFLASARRLELSAPPRALAAAAAAGLGLLVALALALTTTWHADAAAAVGFALACPFVVRLARVRDALKLSRRGRRVLTLTVFGGPVAVLAAFAAEGRGNGIVVLVIAVALLAIGSAAGLLEEPFLPAKGRLLEALADATRSAHDRDTRAAISKALARIREAAGHNAQNPELWMFHPTRVCTVDAAGYLQERPAELPLLLLDLCEGEPGGMVRVDVLSALEVRQAELRPLLRWLEVRGALFATLIKGSGGEEADGIIVVPAGTRSDSVSIEEVHAAKLFADAFVAVCQARSARERHLAREQTLVERAEQLDDRIAALEHAASLDASRNELASARLARPATVGIYSAASRMAYEALERRILNDAPLVLVARAGVDPVPFVARAHLTGPRRAGPLVIVDGTSSREHDVERWQDPHASPLALADRGLLVLVDGAALPREIQVLVARALAERRPPWERPAALDIMLAFTASAPPATLVEQALLAPELAARLEDASPIELPRLRDRPEDLFSIVSDRLAREGLRVRGRPMGIDAAAFGRLVEHAFEGEDAELSSLVTRLVAHAPADVVKLADVDALGLPPPEADEAPEPHRRGPRAVG